MGVPSEQKPSHGQRGLLRQTTLSSVSWSLCLPFHFFKKKPNIHKTGEKKKKTPAFSQNPNSLHIAKVKMAVSAAVPGCDVMVLWDHPHAG